MSYDYRVQDGARRRVAGEVLELGQALFDTVIEAAAAPPPPDGEEPAVFPVDDVRAAADEFFAALRALLGAQTQGTTVDATD